MGKLQHIEEAIDKRSGEVIITKKTFAVKSKNKQEFFMVFLSGLNAICELTRPSDIKILACMCERAEYNTGAVRLTSEDRKQLVDKLKITSQAFSNSLSRLKDTGLVTGERGMYEVNPQHFWKGETNERERLLKAKTMNLLIKYDEDEEK